MNLRVMIVANKCKTAFAKAMAVKGGEYMAELIKETVTTQKSDNESVVVSPVEVTATNSQTVEYSIYFFFGALEILLTFRLILNLLGASIISSFVTFIYGLSGIIIMPFEGIFRRAVSQGIETASVLEPATIVAMIVYAILLWGVIKLYRLLSGKQQVS